MYDKMEHGGEEFIELLNKQAPSQKLFTVAANSGETLYGDGQVTWNYLHMDPEQQYGALADVMMP